MSFQGVRKLGTESYAKSASTTSFGLKLGRCLLANVVSDIFNTIRNHFLLVDSSTEGYRERASLHTSSMLKEKKRKTDSYCSIAISGQPPSQMYKTYSISPAAPWLDRFQYLL